MKIMDLLGHIRPRAYRSGRFFMGYRRSTGRPGARNELWIIPTDEESRAAAKKIASEHHKPYWIDAVRVLNISFASEGEERSSLARSTLSGLAKSPNAAGVLFIGPNHGEVPLFEIMTSLGSEWTRRRVKSVTPDGPEIARAHIDLDEFAANAPRVREKFLLEELAVGVICAERDLQGAPQCADTGRLADAIDSSGGVPLVPVYALAGDDASSRMANRHALSRWKIMREWSSAHDAAASTPCAGACESSGRMPISAVLDLGEEARYGGAKAIFARAGTESGVVSAAASCAQAAVVTSLECDSKWRPMIPTLAIDAAGGDVMERLIAVMSGEKVKNEGWDIDYRLL